MTAIAAKADELLKLASEIVAAYVSNNSVPVSELPAMIKSVHATLGGLSGGGVRARRRRRRSRR